MSGPTTMWAESQLGEAAWERSQRAATPWAIFGAVVGALVALVAFAPASWLAAVVAARTNEQLILADARGTVWDGSASLVLSAGRGSRDASTLPGRIAWQVGLAGLAAEIRLSHPCCLNGTQRVRIRPGLGRFAVQVPGGSDWIALWPAAALTGLGTPFNALDLGGALRLASPGLTVESVQGRWRIAGSAALGLEGISSRLVALPAVGSYQLTVAEDGSGGTAIGLATTDGALRLSGSGSLGPTGLRFRGEASAAPAQAQALNNLLNIVGRRDGARSVISIG